MELDLAGVATDSFAGDGDATAVRCDKAAEHRNDRSFSCAVGAQQPHDFALPGGARHARTYLARAVGFPKFVRLQHCPVPMTVPAWYLDDLLLLWFNDKRTKSR